MRARGPMEPFDLRPARDLHLPLGERWKSTQRESGLLDALLRRATWGLVRAYLLAFHRLRIAGRANIPAHPPFVIVANHASHLDVLCIAAAAPLTLRHSIFPLAAGDTFFETPTTAALSAICLNALPLWRNNCGRHALDALRSRLIDEPCAYILFPEGTRSRTGEMAAFKPGLGMLVAGTKIPVVPCRVEGTFAALPPERKSPRALPLAVRFGEPLSFAGVEQSRAGWEGVAAACEAAVRGLAITYTCTGE